jgi:hypothetical protein
MSSSPSRSSLVPESGRRKPGAKRNASAAKPGWQPARAARIRTARDRVTVMRRIVGSLHRASGRAFLLDPLFRALA